MRSQPVIIPYYIAWHPFRLHIDSTEQLCACTHACMHCTPILCCAVLCVIPRSPVANYACLALLTLELACIRLVNHSWTVCPVLYIHSTHVRRVRCACGVRLGLVNNSWGHKAEDSQGCVLVCLIKKKIIYVVEYLIYVILCGLM